MGVSPANLGQAAHTYIPWPLGIVRKAPCLTSPLDLSAQVKGPERVGCIQGPRPLKVELNEHPGLQPPWQGPLWEAPEGARPLVAREEELLPPPFTLHHLHHHVHDVPVTGIWALKAEAFREEAPGWLPFSPAKYFQPLTEIPSAAPTPALSPPGLGSRG